MCDIYNQTNNFQNSKNGTSQNFHGANIGLQKNIYLLNLKKIDRYDIYNLSKKKDIIIPKKNQIEIFDIKKIRTELKTLSNIHVFCIFSFYLAIVVAMLIYINILPLNYSFIVFTSVVLSILSYFTLYVKSNNKKYTKALININLNNLKNIKIINDKITNNDSFLRYFSLYYYINKIVEPYYNYYSYVILIDEEDNETYLHFKTRKQYKDFNILITRFYIEEVITD